MLDDARYITHAISKTLNPEWNVTFELPITGVQSLLLQCVCWDKDRFGKVHGFQAWFCTICVLTPF